MIEWWFLRTSRLSHRMCHKGDREGTASVFAHSAKTSLRRCFCFVTCFSISTVNLLQKQARFELFLHPIHFCIGCEFYPYNSIGDVRILSNSVFCFGFYFLVKVEYNQSNGGARKQWKLKNKWAVLSNFTNISFLVRIVISL